MKPEFVRSRYRARWRGVVLEREKRKGRGDLLTILILIDQHGNQMRKRNVVTLDEYWTEPCAAISTATTNPDWFKF